MIWVIIIILGILVFEDYILIKKKKWKELIIVSTILSLCFYFTLAENRIVPEIQIIETLDNIFKPLSKFIEQL